MIVRKVLEHKGNERRKTRREKEREGNEEGVKQYLTQGGKKMNRIKFVSCEHCKILLNIKGQYYWISSAF